MLFNALISDAAAPVAKTILRGITLGGCFRDLKQQKNPENTQHAVT